MIKLLFLILLLPMLVAIAQDTPKPELLDEFGALPCDEMLGRVDAFIAALGSDPASKGAILIYSPTVKPELANGRRKLISSTLQNRGVESARYEIFRDDRSPDGEIRTKFWKVPLGATPPVAESQRWNEPAPDLAKPFVFGYADETDVCPTYVPKAFAKLLLSNPGSVGRIVVTTGSDPLVNRYAFGENFVNDLVRNHGVPRKRLRLIFRKSRNETGAEFWFVPRGRGKVDSKVSH